MTIKLLKVCCLKGSIPKKEKLHTDESPSDFGFALRRLGQKAYPSVPYSGLEAHVLDQFISGLGSIELQKHVQFHHPKTLEAAINLAMEYTAFVGNVDKVVKPQLNKEGEITSTVTKLESHDISSLRPLEFKPNFSLKDMEQAIDQIVTRKLDSLTDKLLQGMQDKLAHMPTGNTSTHRDQGNTTQRDKSPYRKRDATPNRLRGQNSPNRQPLNAWNPQEPRSIICTYCSRKGHVENRCYSKMRDMEANASSQKPLN